MKVTLAGRDFELDPHYKLGALSRAAPFLDEVQSLDGFQVTATSVISLGRSMVGVIWAGLVRNYPELMGPPEDETAGLDALYDDCDLTEIFQLRGVIIKIQESSGMGAPKEGEPAADSEQGSPGNRKARRALSSSKSKT